MPELQSNGIYEAYLSELFNPLAGGTQFNPAVNPLASGAQFNPGGQFNTGGMAGIGGVGMPQTPWATQAFPQQAYSQQIYPQQQHAFPQQAYSQQIYPQQQQAFPQLSALWPQQQTQALHAQHIAAKQAVQAIQISQVLQALQQIVQTIAGQQQHLAHSLAHVAQPQVSHGAFGVQNPQALQQQTMQQLLQYLGVQQPMPFRYGMAV
jgi:hypothetical protein